MQFEARRRRAHVLLRVVCPELLRGVYVRADLRIKPKSTMSKHEMVIEAIRHMLSPEELQRIGEALAQPDTKYLDPEEVQREEIRGLSQALRTSLKRELLNSHDSRNLRTAQILRHCRRIRGIKLRDRGTPVRHRLIESQDREAKAAWTRLGAGKGSDTI